MDQFNEPCYIQFFVSFLHILLFFYTHIHIDMYAKLLHLLPDKFPPTMTALTAGVEVMCSKSSNAIVGLWYSELLHTYFLVL